jgi:predicted SnoaL-like aldol condensation-catalyzing enzyme
MTDSSAKDSLRRFVDLVWNQGRLERVGEFVAADYLGHDRTARPVVDGPAGVRDLVAGWRARCPDLHVRLDETIAEDGIVAVRWTVTGARAMWTGISVVRLLAGKQVESWTQCARMRHRGDTAGVLPVRGAAPPG